MTLCRQSVVPYSVIYGALALMYVNEPKNPSPEYIGPHL